MQYSPGDIVRSTAGRDRGHLYVVVAVTVSRVMVADGRRRMVSAPKAKNAIHLQLVSNEGCPILDEQIRHILHSSVFPADKGGGN